jgi:hypothetical protein
VIRAGKSTKEADTAETIGWKMGICCRVILLDEMDWGYVGFSKANVEEQVLSVFPDAKLEATIYKMMIFDIGKEIPQKLIGKVTCDAIMVMDDHDNFIPKLLK